MSLALELDGIEKRFGGVVALSGARLSARRGEIVGLCGENGAGKSTLLKVLSGVHPFGSYAGTARALGKELRLSGTADARRAGIAIVHQELMLPPNLTVAECLLLGREPGRLGFVDDAALEGEARALLARYGFADEIDARAEVASLGIGLQQVVEIVRALSYETAILVLDEPTAALTGREAERLLAWLRDLRAAGTTCVYVSHRLDEVFALCDRITVLRDGRTVLEVETHATTPDEVVRAMVGRAVAADVRAAPRSAAHAAAKPVLEISRLSVGLPGDAAAVVAEASGAARATRLAVDDVSLDVGPGEVLALAGAMGAGRTALLSTIFGCALGAVRGSVRLDGAPLDARSPAEAIARGVVLVPEDRKGRGLVLGMTVGENLGLPPVPSGGGLLARLGFTDPEAEEAEAAERVAALRVRGTPTTEVAALSGGNQQKVVVGKWLARPPRVLLLDEPTRGVDVGARDEIYGIVEELARAGTAVLVASSDLSELRRLAHRILVLRQGRVAGELDGRTATDAEIVALGTGAFAGQVAPAETALAPRPKEAES